MPSDADTKAGSARTLKQDERYRVLAESAPDAIVTIDEQNIILSVNPATERIFGWSSDGLAAGFERKVTFASYFLKPFYSDTSHQSKD